MATVRIVTFQYEESPKEVAALLQDPVFLRHRSEAAGEHNIEVQVERKDDVVHVTVAREKSVDIPALARAVVGSARRAVEKTVWRQEGETWSAEYTIEVSGVPVTTQGRSLLTPNGRGCQYMSTFEISARVPLIGGRIEAMAADAFEGQLLQNAERNAAALARSGKRVAHSHVDELRGDVPRTGEST